MIKKIGDDILESAESAMSYDFEQKTERAGVVMDLIESREDPEERVVMLTRMFSFLKNRYFRCNRENVKEACLEAF